MKRRQAVRLLNGLFPHPTGKMVNADDRAIVQAAGDEFAGAVKLGDKIAEGFKSHTRARLAESARRNE
jgi:hypothetical protein